MKSEDLIEFNVFNLSDIDQSPDIQDYKLQFCSGSSQFFLPSQEISENNSGDLETIGLPFPPPYDNFVNAKP